MEICFYNHIIFFSYDLLNEIANKLHNKIKIPESIVNEIIDFLKDHSQIVFPAPLKNNVCRDRDDDNIISLAIYVQSDYIVTGDKDLLVLKNYKSIPIVSPREFWNILQNNPKK